MLRVRGYLEEAEAMRAEGDSPEHRIGEPAQIDQLSLFAL